MRADCIKFSFLFSKSIGICWNWSYFFIQLFFPESSPRVISQMVKQFQLFLLKLLNFFLISFYTMYVPSFNVNLVSISRLTADNTIGLFFLQTKCIMQDLSKWRMIGLAEIESGIYHLRRPLDQSNNKCLLPSSLVKSCILTSDLWHFHLGHISTSKINLLSNFDSSVTATSNFICQIYPLAKQKRLPFLLSKNKSSRAFQLVHIDICGPFSVSSYSGYRFFLTIVDDYTRFTWLFLMKSKSETRAILTNFLAYVHTHFNTNIQTLRSDNG